MVESSLSGIGDRDAGAILVRAVKAAKIVLALEVPGSQISARLSKQLVAVAAITRTCRLFAGPMSDILSDRQTLSAGIVRASEKAQSNVQGRRGSQSKEYDLCPVSVPVLTARPLPRGSSLPHLGAPQRPPR